MTMPEPDATPPAEAAVPTPARGIAQTVTEAPAAPTGTTAPADGVTVPAAVVAVPGASPTGSAGPGLGVLALPAAAAGIAYAATLVVAFVASIALLAALPDGPALSAGALLSLPFVLTGTALLGPLHAGGAAYGYDAVSVQLGVVPLTLTFVALAAVAAWTHLRAPADRTPKERWRDALITGGVLGVGGAVLAALVRLTWSVDVVFVSADVKIGAAPVGTLLGGFLVGTLGSALGSALTRRGPDTRRLGFALPRTVSSTLGNLAVAGVVSAVLVAVVGSVVGIVKLGLTTTVTLLLTLLPNATVYALALGGFGGLTSTGGVTGGGDQTVTLFSDGTPGGLWACVALVLVAVLVAAVRGVLASGRRGWGEAWVTPVVLLAVTGLAAIVTSVRLSASGELADSDTGALHLSLATVLLAACWGLVIEVAERLVAPHLLTLVPALPRQYARLTGHDPAAVASTPSEAPAGDQRTARLVALGVLGAVVVLGGLAAVRAVVANAVFGPQVAARAYVAAIEDGRVSDAFALADPDLPNGQRTLMTDDVYGSVEHRPAGGRVTAVEKSGDDAWVTVESKQDGATVTQDLHLTKRGHRFLVFDRWVLASPELPSVDLYAALPTDVTTVLVDGVEVELSGGSVFDALPGTYTLALPVPDGSSGLLASSEAQVVVEWPSDYATSYPTTEGELGYALTDEAESQAEQLAADYVTTDCIGAGTLSVEECGLDVWEYREDEATGVAWTLDGEPSVETTLESPEEVSVHVSGSATVSYTLPAADYWPAESPVETDDYDFWITYSMTDGELVQTEVSEWGW